ncbi:MAG: sigma 54-interacting transcriptional regulator [Sandaracinaceae bacterium]
MRLDLMGSGALNRAVGGDDADTRSGSRHAAAPPSERAVSALTIALHPDPRRLGERTLVLAREDGAPIRLARRETTFAHPHGDAPARALDDPYVSREPVELKAEGGHITIRARAAARLRVDGELAPAELRVGAMQNVVLTLADRVVLLLHPHVVGEVGPTYGITGRSRAIAATRRAIRRVADLDAPVLLRGPSGVGKERVALAIHAASGRAGELVSINVAALPPSLASSELFGHARGAFTGAGAAHRGLFERADGGTLFLDEVGELAPEVQPMLLRALEQGTVRRLGEETERPIDVRVIAATDADLERDVDEGRMRAALYHRLRGFEIAVPPLAERIEDLPALMLEMLEAELTRTGELARLEGDDPDRPMWIDPRLVERLLAHGWPGNVRALRALVRQLVVANRTEPSLVADRAVEGMLGPRASRASLADAKDVSDDALLEALERAGWSFTKAASALGVSKSALYRRAEGHPGVRVAAEIGDEELESALADHGGDLRATAAALKVSLRALKLRCARR